MEEDIYNKMCISCEKMFVGKGKGPDLCPKCIMEKDLEQLETNIDYNSLLLGYGDAELSLNIRNTVKHLIQAYKDQQAELEKKDKQIEQLNALIDEEM